MPESCWLLSRALLALLGLAVPKFAIMRVVFVLCSGGHAMSQQPLQQLDGPAVYGQQQGLGGQQHHPGERPDAPVALLPAEIDMLFSGSLQRDHQLSACHMWL